jgi:hypothetical protein
MLRRTNDIRISAVLVAVLLFGLPLAAQECTTICGEIHDAGGQPANYCVYPAPGCPASLYEYDGCCCLVV